MPFQPNTFSAFANQSTIVAKNSNILARIDKGQVPNNTTKTIIKIVRIRFFIRS